MPSINPLSPDIIRGMFASAVSQMYREEVPQYGTLLELVADINVQVSDSGDGPYHGDNQTRIEVERHGAIRLGTPEELAMMRRLLSILGMEPVGYYDLTVAGLPVHATGFRPTTRKSLEKNPFRVFTSLLRLDLIHDQKLHNQVLDILARRHIFTPRCITLIEQFESIGCFATESAQEFIKEALETFRWHSSTTVSIEIYQQLHAIHPLIADVVCFRGPHINHLTPRVLDIDTAQVTMQKRGLHAKAVIEGPPPRTCSILLRQTSFLALEEKIAFSGGSILGGKHKARFGEIEQRGMALTPKGRGLYDELLARVNESILQLPAENRSAARSTLLHGIFQAFPDDLATIHRERLAYFTYKISRTSSHLPGSFDIQSLVDAGLLVPVPITYEDFLPVSAAGIFHSNLGETGEWADSVISSDQAAFEDALGCTVHDSFQLYQRIEKESVRECLGILNSNVGQRGGG